jgi:hypothetical protein
MRRWWSFALVFAVALAATSFTLATQEEKPRNPFGVGDVTDPDGADVKEFAEKVKLPGDGQDANAAQWSEKPTEGKTASLDGEWFSRWNGGGAANNWEAGTAKVKAVGDRVYILYEDKTGKYLIDARREGKRRLVGRYVNLAAESDSSPWVGVVVDDERIDGEWGSGRWDLRRKIAD